MSEDDNGKPKQSSSDHYPANAGNDVRMEHQKEHSEAKRQKRREKNKQRRNKISQFNKSIRNFFRPTNRWRVIFQYILPSLTGFLTLSLLFAQSIIYKRQLHEMKRAAKANIIAANSARKSVELAERSERQDRRPWVVVANVQLEKALTKGEKAFIKVAWSNSGRMPAFDAVITGKAFVSATVLEESEMTFSQGIRDDYRGSRIIVPPQNNISTSRVQSEETLSDFQIKDIQAEKSLLYVVGFLRYTDKLSGMQHQTFFCYWLSQKETDAGQAFNACIHGNTAD